MKNSSNKVLTIAVVVLLIINIALVILMMQGPRKGGDRMHSKGGEPFEMMVKELDMSSQQQTDYKSMKEDHMKAMRPLFDSVRAAKTAFYALIKQETSDSLVNTYQQRIADKQAEIDKLTFAHFKRVRGLFTPAQQPKFDEFLQKMMQRKKDSASKKERK